MLGRAFGERDAEDRCGGGFFRQWSLARNSVIASGILGGIPVGSGNRQRVKAVAIKIGWSNSIVPARELHALMMRPRIGCA